MSESLLEVSGLRKYYKVGGGLLGRGAKKVHAVDGVSFDIKKGETLSIVGESGCGKSTVARSVLGLTDITEGVIRLAGNRIDHLGLKKMRPMRKRMQVVFQDPFSSLNPRMRVRDILAESLRNFEVVSEPSQVQAHLDRLMDMVQLSREGLNLGCCRFRGHRPKLFELSQSLSD